MKTVEILNFGLGAVETNEAAYLTYKGYALKVATKAEAEAIVEAGYTQGYDLAARKTFVGFLLIDLQA